MQEIIFYFDDSGVFHKNDKGGYFIYAGYTFANRNELNNARQKYRSANKLLKNALGRTDELKASTLKFKHRRMLFNSVKEYNSMVAVVDISKIYDHILSDKKSICRYKDYIIKRCVKRQLQKFIADGNIKTNEDVLITINIDQQLTASNGYYGLKHSIKEELQHGIVNYDYGFYRPPVFNADVNVNVRYCNSSCDYMIQASDILANRIRTSYITKNQNLREINNNILLTFP